MCYQIIELYSACRCLYYQHAVDFCASYGRPGHDVRQKTILVGYACASHSSSSGIGSSGYYSTSHHLTKPQTTEPVDDDPHEQRSKDIPLTSDDINGVEVDGDDGQTDDDGGNSVFSSFSAASTNLTLPGGEAQDIAPALFGDFLNEPSLRHLWPQVVMLSRTKLRAEVNIARFLKRFSEDLQKRAGSNIERDATKFIRRLRWDIARRIFESHAAEIASSKPMPELEPEAGDDVPPDTLQNADEDQQAKITYSELHQFLFSKESPQGSSIDSLIFNVKVFVAKGAPASNASASQHAPVRLLRQIHNKFHMQAPAPLSGAVTLHWRCVSRHFCTSTY